MKHVPEEAASQTELKQVFLVKDYCIKHGLAEREQQKMLSLLGQFASEHELRMNVQRRPLWR